MALTDLRFSTGQTHFGATTERAQAGAVSLKYDGDDGLADDVLAVVDQSITDAPTEGRIIYQMNIDEIGGDEVGGEDTTYGGVHGVVFRYQDVDNYYTASITPQPGDEVNDNRLDPTLAFGKVVNGSFTTIDSESDTTFDETTDSWFRYRWTFWESGGNIFLRMEQEQGGSFVQIASDLTDSNPELAGGGGMGLGEIVTHANNVILAGNNANHDRGRIAYWDELEVFY